MADIVDDMKNCPQAIFTVPPMLSEGIPPQANAPSILILRRRQKSRFCHRHSPTAAHRYRAGKASLCRANRILQSSTSHCGKPCLKAGIRSRTAQSRRLNSSLQGRALLLPQAQENTGHHAKAMQFATGLLVSTPGAMVIEVYLEEPCPFPRGHNMDYTRAGTTKLVQILKAKLAPYWKCLAS